MKGVHLAQALGGCWLLPIEGYLGGTLQTTRLFGRGGSGAQSRARPRPKPHRKWPTAAVLSFQSFLSVFQNLSACWLLFTPISCPSNSSVWSSTIVSPYAQMSLSCVKPADLPPTYYMCLKQGPGLLAVVWAEASRGSELPLVCRLALWADSIFPPRP